MSEKSRTKKQPAGRQPTAPCMALDISDTDQNWPPEIPEKLQRHLEKEVVWFMKIDRAQKSMASHSLVQNEAVALRKSALRLLDKFRRFSNDHQQVAIYENHRNRAVDRLRAWIPDLDDDKFRLFRTGMEPLSMQFPLIGLAEWAGEIANTPSGKDGRRPANKERRAVAEIIRCFEYLTFDQTIDEDVVLLRTCQAFLARTGNPKSSDTVYGYIAAVKEKTWENILKFSP